MGEVGGAEVTGLLGESGKDSGGVERDGASDEGVADGDPMGSPSSWNEGLEVGNQMQTRSFRDLHCFPYPNASHLPKNAY